MPMTMKLRAGATREMKPITISTMSSTTTIGAASLAPVTKTSASVRGQLVDQRAVDLPSPIGRPAYEAARPEGSRGGR